MSIYRRLALITTAVLFASAAVSEAGPLATDGTSIWHASTTFGSGADYLQGHVDYAVYGPGTLPAGFAPVGAYVPTPGEYLYTYQVYVTGTAPLSEMTVFFDNAADNIGAFTATGVSGGPATSATLFSALYADWTFSIPTGSQSVGVAFSSPMYPTAALGTVVDHGTSQLVIPLPVPSDHLIPEPSTLVLASCGLGLLALSWLHGRAPYLKFSRHCNGRFA
jgi:hypothetical protein